MPLPIPCTSSVKTPDFIISFTAAIGSFMSVLPTLVSILSIISDRNSVSFEGLPLFSSRRIFFACPVGSTIAEIVRICCQITAVVSTSAFVKISLISTCTFCEYLISVSTNREISFVSIPSRLVVTKSLKAVTCLSIDFSCERVVLLIRCEYNFKLLNSLPKTSAKSLIKLAMALNATSWF